MKDNRLLQFLKKYWVIGVFALTALGAVFSSVEIYKEEVLNIDPDIKYEAQDTLYFAAERIDTLNPLISQSEDVYYLSKLLYSSLFAYDENLSAVPELVRSYTVNTERAYIDLKLKKKVNWHNGKRLRAEDVRFTVSAIKAVGSTSPYYEKVSKIISVNVTDTYACRIYFNNNYNCSLDDLTFPIVPSTQYASALQFARAKEDFKPIGTGVYQYKSYNYLKYLRMVPNEDYFGTQAENKIYVTIVPDRDLAENLMEIEMVTCYLDNSSSRKSVVSDKQYQMYNIVSNQLEMLVYNTKTGICKDLKTRQAISAGINREKILANAYMGDGVLTDSIYYPNYLGVQDEGISAVYDYQKAVELLEAAGFSYDDHDGELEKTGVADMPVTILVNKKNATRTAAARLIAANLESLGFKTNVQALTAKAYQAAMKKGDFDLLLVGYSIEENYDLRAFFNGKNPWKYTNFPLLTQVNELERMHTNEEYQEIYRSIKQQLAEELPYEPLCYKYVGLVGVPYFEAEQLPLFHDIYKNCQTWRWSKVIEPEKETETGQNDNKNQNN